MMPNFIGNDSLIARVNEVEGCMYRQSNELGRLNKAVRRYKADNAKLRELVRILAHCASGHGCDICQINGGEGLINILDMCESVHDRMRELGIEDKSE